MPSSAFNACRFRTHEGSSTSNREVLAFPQFSVNPMGFHIFTSLICIKFG